MKRVPPRPSPMQPDRSTPFRSLLEAAASASDHSLVARARLLDALDRRLRQSLPPEVASRCRLANIREDRLVFLVDSPVWKTKLRLHADSLLAAADAAGVPARSLTVKVATMLPVPPDAAPHIPLSPTARENLRTVARSITDPELRAVLEKLASSA